FPRTQGISESEIGEDRHGGKVEAQIEQSINRALPAHWQIAVDDVGTYMSILGQSVSSSKHEDGTVEHVRDVVCPDRRSVEEISTDYLIDKGGYHGENEPGGKLSHQYAGKIQDGGDNPDDLLTVCQFSH